MAAQCLHLPGDRGDRLNRRVGVDEYRSPQRQHRCVGRSGHGPDQVGLTVEPCARGFRRSMIGPTPKMSVSSDRDLRAANATERASWQSCSNCRWPRPASGRPVWPADPGPFRPQPPAGEPANSPARPRIPPPWSGPRTARPTTTAAGPAGRRRRDQQTLLRLVPTSVILIAIQPAAGDWAHRRLLGDHGLDATPPHWYVSQVMNQRTAAQAGGAWRVVLAR